MTRSRPAGVRPPDPVQDYPDFEMMFADSTSMWDEYIPPPTWVIPQFLALGDIAFLVGQGSSGKSWLCMSLAMSLALGEACLDGAGNKLPPKRVLIIDRENQWNAARTRMRKLAIGMVGSVSGEARRLLDENLIYPPTRQKFDLSNPKCVREIQKVCDDREVDIVIFDSLSGVSGINDINAQGEIRALYNKVLTVLCAHGRRTILVIHHTRKPPNEKIPGSFDPADGNNARGSGDIRDSADTMLMMWRDKGQTSLASSKARYDDDGGVSPPQYIVMRMEKRGKENDTEGVYLAFDGAKPSRGNGATLNESGVLCILSERQVPMSKSQLEEALGISAPIGSKTLYSLLASMVRAGKIDCSPDPADRRVKFYQLTGFNFYEYFKQA